MSSFYYHHPAAAAAAASGEGLPHINIDDQFSALETGDWNTNTDGLVLGQPEEQDLSSSYFVKDHSTPRQQQPQHPELPLQRQHQHQHQHTRQQYFLPQHHLIPQHQPSVQQYNSHLPLNRFVHSDITDGPFAFGLAFQSNQFDPFTLSRSFQEVNWASELASPVDSAFSCTPAHLYIPAASIDTNSNQTGDSGFSRNSTSPVSDYYGRSPVHTSGNYYLPSNHDSCSNDGSSCVAPREIHSQRDIGNSAERTPSISSMHGQSWPTDTGAFSLPHADEDALHVPDVELDDIVVDTTMSAYENTAIAEDATESETEAAETYDVASHSEPSDSEYDPSPSRHQRPSRRTRQNTGGGNSGRRRSSTLATEQTHRVSKPKQQQGRGTNRLSIGRMNSGASSSTSTAASTITASTTDRPFTCPLMPFGCEATFASKNEWKRHFTIQHVALGFFKCDLCPAGRPNTFNRKDLFKQHLRRMHRGDRDGHPALVAVGDAGAARRRSAGLSAASSSLADEEAFEAELESVRMRCWKQLRAAPTRLACVFCASPPAAAVIPPTPGDEHTHFFGQSASSHTPMAPAVPSHGRTFEGPGCCDEWLEHVGRHLSAAAAAARDGRTDPITASREIAERWAADATLRDWLLTEGILEAAADGTLVIAGATAEGSASATPTRASKSRRGGLRGEDALDD